MERRRTGFAIGILTLCCVGLLASVIYPIAPDTPHAETPSEEQFWVPDTEPYSATGEIVVDRDRQVAFEEITTSSGERYQLIEEHGQSNTTTERYQSAPHATIYKRLAMDRGTTKDRMREQIVDDDSQQLLEENHADSRATFVVASNSSNQTAGFPDPAAVVVQSLQVVSYDQPDAESSTTIEFKPENGWYGASNGYRVTNATGELRVDTETNTVESASVSWDVTKPAGSYVEYVVTRSTSSDPMTHEISFEHQPDDPKTGRPQWVPES